LLGVFFVPATAASQEFIFCITGEVCGPLYQITVVEYHQISFFLLLELKKLRGTRGSEDYDYLFIAGRHVCFLSCG
jgi:hypothetical protein